MSTPKDSRSNTPNKLPAFDDVCSLLVPLGALNSPAELHGMVCGKLSGGARFSESEWLQAVVEYMDLAQDMPADTNTAVTQLYPISLAQLGDDSFSLELLLPDDDTELPLRADALGQWCQGYLSGFGSSGIKGESSMSSEVADALRDIAAIVQIDVEDDDENEESEANLLEITEYVRLSAINVFMECGSLAQQSDSLQDSPSPKDTKLH